MGLVTSYESWTDDSTVFLRNNDGKLAYSDDAGELLAFLRYSASATIRVAWDLDSFVAHSENATSGYAGTAIQVR